MISKNKKHYLFLLLMVFITLILLGCNSKYNKLVDKYEEQYNLAVNEIDENNVYESVVENKLQDRLKDMDEIVKQIDEDVPNPDNNKYISIKNRHETLTKLVERILNWEQLNDWDRFSIESNVLAIKMTQDQPKE